MWVWVCVFASENCGERMKIEKKMKSVSKRVSKQNETSIIAKYD